MKIIHTSSGSKLEYEKIGKDREVHDNQYDAKEISIEQAKKEQDKLMELPKALIKGYRELSVHEKEQINFIKYMGIEIGKMCDKVEQMHNIDERWLAIGRTNLQQGLMAITRAIAKPETF